MKNKLPILIALFSFLLFVPTYSYVRAQARSSLTVSPSRQELFVDPGERTALNINFFNNGDKPVSGILKVADFVVEDKEGSPTFLETPVVTGTTQISRRFSAASWVTLPYDRMTIAAKDKISINAKMAVPADARPGGRYIAIYFEAAGKLPEAKGTFREAGSPVSQQIAGLVYLRVAGPITEEARVVQVTAPRFSEYGPISVTTEILNLGDYHIRPKGTITVTNLFGQQVDQVKLVEQNIFPDASRTFSNAVGTKWMVGKYKAELAASYGETGKALTAVIFFWVFPWKVTLIVILTVVIVILLVNILYRRSKKRQQELEEKIEELEKKLEEKK